MSYGKFASITSELLARKGDAAPSAVATQMGPALHSMPHAILDAPGTAEARKKNGKARETKRRIVLTLTREEFERLGIAAVKTGTTPHELAQAALFEKLDAVAAEFGACECMVSDTPCVCEAEGGRR